MRSIKADSSRKSVSDLVSQLSAKSPASILKPPKAAADTAETTALRREGHNLPSNGPRMTQETAPYLQGYCFEPYNNLYMRESLKYVYGPSGNKIAVTTHKYYSLDEALSRMEQESAGKNSMAPAAVAQPKTVRFAPTPTPAPVPAKPKAAAQSSKPPRLTEETAPRLEGFRFLSYANIYERESTKYVALPDGREIPVTTHKEYTLEQALNYMDRKAAEKKNGR